MTKKLKPSIMQIVNLLFPFNYSVVGKGADMAVDTYLGLLPFKIHKFKSGSELRGWKIPKGWDVDEATIRHKGEIVYDCIKMSKLGCAYLSPSFNGVIQKNELKTYCSYREDLPEAIVYDWTRLYRQGEKKWGLSIPFKDINQLPSEDLSINIQTRTYDSEMNVYDFLIPGKSSKEIIITAHNCHPYQANDDISGCSAAISIMIDLLEKKDELRYSYRIIIAPELYGPMFWLEKNKSNANNIFGCILLKSIGNNKTMKLQNSYEGDTYLDQVSSYALKNICGSNERYSFRSYYGNDETVFEAPGFDVPCITFTRFPFLEYHTNLDTQEILHEDKLEETKQAVLNMIHIFETNKRASKVEDGLFCLSNPKYNLYKSAPEPGISSKGNTETERSWNLLMNCLTRDLSSGLTILDIALKYKLDYDVVHDYIHKWEECGLVFLEEVS